LSVAARGLGVQRQGGRFFISTILEKIKLGGAILQESVALATGDPNAAPRTQQSAMMRQMIASFEENRRYGAQAPTGSGKSFAYLSAIAAQVITDGRKAVVSTETKQLQSQIASKDLPMVNEAARSVTGRGITFATLKGRQNYVCLHALLTQMGISTDRALDLPTIGAILQRDMSDPLYAWLIAHLGKPEWNGGTEDIPVGKYIPQQAIESITVSSQECLGSKCPFREAEMCYADQAIEAVLEADVVITNHSLLAMELVTRAPIVLRRGDRKADIVVIDEAHSLESVVRSHESTVINPVSILYTIKQATMVDVKRIRADAERASIEFQRALATASSIEVVPSSYHRSNVRFHRVLDTKAIALVSALERLQRRLPENTTNIDILKIRARIATIIASLNQFLQVTEEEQSAIWIEERSENNYVLLVQSIQLSTRLYAALDERTNDEEETAAIAAVSATLPEIIARNILGPEMQYESFSSPFTVAYEDSRLLIPCDQRSLANGKFNHTIHQEWSASVIADLVTANNGSALVLSTSATGAKFFHDELKKMLPASIPLIFYQDGSSKAVVDAWKSDQHSVLVATRGMMTGVDAPGITCSLVIIDRVPRAPTGITNELRVESLVSQSQLSRYLAEARVYGGDASILLEQAAGRLIRSSNDRGLLAILDPRLCQGQKFSYRPPYMRYYRDALGSWGGEFSSVSDAVDWLADRSRPA
jgi:ATP-dependent DNA helicase DinG